MRVSDDASDKSRFAPGRHEFVHISVAGPVVCRFITIIAIVVVVVNIIIIIIIIIIIMIIIIIYYL